MSNIFGKSKERFPPHLLTFKGGGGGFQNHLICVTMSCDDSLQQNDIIFTTMALSMKDIPSSRSQQSPPFQSTAPNYTHYEISVLNSTHFIIQIFELFLVKTVKMMKDAFSHSGEERGGNSHLDPTLIGFVLFCLQTNQPTKTDRGENMLSGGI